MSLRDSGNLALRGYSILGLTLLNSLKIGGFLLCRFLGFPFTAILSSLVVIRDILVSSLALFV